MGIPQEPGKLRCLKQNERMIYLVFLFIDNANQVIRVYKDMETTLTMVTQVSTRLVGPSFPLSD